jgi:hypothetical protein
MQRSLSYKISLAPIILLPLFVFYESLSSIYLLMPPLLGVLFHFFIKSKESENFRLLISIIIMLIIFEAEKGYLFLSTLFYFTLLYQFIIPTLKKNIVCKSCLNLLFMILAYGGYYLFALLMSHIFLLEAPKVDYYVVYYILLEFFVVSLI